MISAAMFRLKNTKEFMIQIGVVCVLPLLFILGGYYQVNLMNAYVIKLLSQFFGHTIVIELLLVMIAAHIWGCEYEFGGIRNKIICGHKRRNIYLTNLFSIVICGIFLNGIYVAINCFVGLPLLGNLKMSYIEFVCYIISDFLLVISTASVFCMISSMVSTESNALRISLAVFFIALICGLVMYKKFSIQEFQGILNDPLLGKVPGRNLLYVGGTKRIVLEFLQCVLPGTQSILILNQNVEHYFFPALGSLIAFIVSTGLGLFLFERRDFK